MSFSANDGTISGISPATKYGLWGDTESQTGVVGTSGLGVGVSGQSFESSGIDGKSTDGYGAYGESIFNAGVYGHSHGTGIDPTRTAGVYGLSEHGPAGVYGESNRNGNGVGVYGFSYYTIGVLGSSSYAEGVRGEGNNFGVRGRCYSGHGVLGEATRGAGVNARQIDIVGGPEAYLALRDLAGGFLGDVYVSGSLKKAGGGFQIDHPLDPSHKYLSHSFVESSDMKNIYDGVAHLDQQGEVVVELPEWFEALNQDFRYQLTSMGAPGPTLHIAEEIAYHQFKIAGGQPGTKVSWQVTGVRRDAWAEANRVEVEKEKPEAESGRYLHPQLYGQSEEEESAFQARYRLPVQVVDLQQKSEEVQKVITEMREKAEEMREQ